MNNRNMTPLRPLDKQTVRETEAELARVKNSRLTCGAKEIGDLCTWATLSFSW